MTEVLNQPPSAEEEQRPLTTHNTQVEHRPDALEAQFAASVEQYVHDQSPKAMAEARQQVIDAREQSEPAPAQHEIVVSPEENFRRIAVYGEYLQMHRQNALHRMEVQG